MLEDHLKNPHNSVIREKLLKHKFLYDIQLEYLKRGKSILYYESEYDRDGFDLLFDNLSTQRHFQMKSIMKSSSTSVFNIHRSLLRPKIDELNYYPLSHDSFGAGYGGGVILIIAEDIDNDLKITYKYSDGLILCAFNAGYFEYKASARQGSVVNAFKSYQDPKKIGGRVKLTKSCFIKFNSVFDLFDYAGLGLYGSGARWNLQRGIARYCGMHDQADSKYTVEMFKGIVKNDFKDLISWSEFKAD